MNYLITLEGVSSGRLVLIGEVPDGALLAVALNLGLPLASCSVPVYPLVAGGLTNDEYNESEAQISEKRPWLACDLDRFEKRLILLLAVPRI